MCLCQNTVFQAIVYIIKQQMFLITNMKVKPSSDSLIFLPHNGISQWVTLAYIYLSF